MNASSPPLATVETASANPGIRRLTAIMRKETIQVFRDPSSILIAFILPLILLILFGYGVSLDIEHIKIDLVLEDRSPDATGLAAAFAQSRYFDAKVVKHRRVAESDITAGHIRGIIVIRANFTALLRHQGDPAPVQIITDGTQPNTAKFVENYARGVISTWAEQHGYEQGERRQQPIAIEQRVWFNEELLSRNFLVPGSVAIVMTLIGTLLTAMVIAREWERGTMEAIMATPVAAMELLLGKIVPYFILGLLSMAMCTLIAVALFSVPFRGSVAALLLLSSCFMIPALGQGYLISAVTKNQFVASMLALFSGFLPAMLLSGFIFEISSMPAVIQAITKVVPATYFVASLQTLFLAGDVWPLLAKSIFFILLIGAVFFILSVFNTRKRLD